MNFRTEVNPNLNLELNLKTNFYSIGSCFANMVGSNLIENKFNCISNPFGIIYNPISIFELLSNSTEFDKFNIQNDGIWYNYKLHSDFRNKDKQKLEKEISSTQIISNESLKDTDVLIITFGTAFIYKLNDKKEFVANCHKVPQKNFIKELLSVEQIIDGFKSVYKTLNKDIKIILTVSPVRHIKDTIELNSASKSILRLACHKLQNSFKNVFYFPSYEIMMDDLRDYRFYKDDLLHPTPFAEEYIWKKFTDSIFNKETLAFIEKWKKLKTSINHKSFNPSSEKHQNFLKNILKKLSEINKIVDCEKEIKLVKEQII